MRLFAEQRSDLVGVDELKRILERSRAATMFATASAEDYDLLFGFESSLHRAHPCDFEPLRSFTVLAPSAAEQVSAFMNNKTNQLLSSSARPIRISSNDECVYPWHASLVKNSVEALENGTTGLWLVVPEVATANVGCEIMLRIW